MKNTINALTEMLSEWVPFDELVQHVPEVFPSQESLKWFWRNHKAELVKENAVIDLNGRLHAHPTRFGKVVINVGQRSVASRVAKR